MAVLAPSPSAMVRIATTVNPGLLRRLRKANRTSAESMTLRRCAGRRGLLPVWNRRTGEREFEQETRRRSGRLG